MRLLAVHALRSADALQLASAGAICRAATGACDVAETCNGSSMNCPVNAVAPQDTQPTQCSGTHRCTGTGSCRLANGEACTVSAGCASASCLAGLCSAGPPPSTPTPTPSPSVLGDCDGDAQLSAQDLHRIVRIVSRCAPCLGGGAVSGGCAAVGGGDKQCFAADLDQNGCITAAELTRIVAAGL